MALAEGRSLPDRAVAITIDDASRSILSEALPRLSAAGLPFTVFVDTDSVGRVGGALTWDEVRALEAAGATIGAHGAAHAHMAFMDRGAIAEDLARMTTAFARELGRTPRLFAYPYGEFGAALAGAIRDAGYLAAFGQHSGVAVAGADLFALPRFALNERYGEIDRFSAIVESLPLPVKDVLPEGMPIADGAPNPPAVGFTVLDGVGPLDRLACYASNGADTELTVLGGVRVELRLDRPFPPGPEPRQLHAAGRRGPVPLARPAVPCPRRGGVAGRFETKGRAADAIATTLLSPIGRDGSPRSPAARPCFLPPRRLRRRDGNERGRSGDPDRRASRGRFQRGTKPARKKASQLPPMIFATSVSEKPLSSRPRVMLGKSAGERNHSGLSGQPAAGGPGFSAVGLPGPASAAHPVEVGGRVLAAHVGADSDAVDAHEFGGVGDHAAEGVEGYAGAADVERVGREAQHAAAFGQRLQHAVGFVAQTLVEAQRIGVGDGDGPFGDVDRLERRQFGRVAHVDRHADPVHLSDDLAARSG